MSELDRIFNEVEGLKERKILCKGQLKSLMERLKGEGFNSVEEAEEELKKLRIKLMRMKKTKAKKTKEFMEKYSDEIANL
jgi:hypothetical protein